MPPWIFQQVNFSEEIGDSENRKDDEVLFNNLAREDYLYEQNKFGFLHFFHRNDWYC